MQACAPTTDTKEAKVDQFYEDLGHLLELTPKKKKKKGPFHHRWLECKSRMSRDTWNNSQILPWSTEWSRAKASRVLSREHTGHSKHPLPITQEMTLYMDVTRCWIPQTDWLCSLQPKKEKLYTVSKNKTWSWLWLSHKLLIAKFRLKLKKIGETTRPFRYDLRQISYDYTVWLTDSRD